MEGLQKADLPTKNEGNEKRLQNFVVKNVPRMHSPLKREIRPKRDIVDPLFHASRAFGHNPRLGSDFSYIWELE